MNIPALVVEWLTTRGYGNVVELSPVGGGCINQGARLTTSAGSTFFLKTNSRVPADMFAREAEGLLALKIDGGPRVPTPFLSGENFLLLEDLFPTTRRQNYWIEFGEQLACLHNHINNRFGFMHDNYIGSTPQVNPWTEDGHLFYAQHRLLYQADLAKQRGLLTSKEAQLAERMSSRLTDWIPYQPASLIHGDLWAGNAISGPAGEPAIIDPAAHYGWAEAELAMTALFGGFRDEFYCAYTDVHPLEKDYQQRFEIYNLYHLLNHLNLFGASYHGEVVRILNRYGGG